MINQTLPWAEWTPDLPDIASGTTLAKNVITHQGSYREFNDLSVTSSALTKYCRGAAFYEDKDGNLEAFAGDETQLYRLAAASWDEKTPASPYACGTSDYFEFVKFGEAVIATNFADNVQYRAFGAAGDFADLGGSPPKAKCIAVVKSFVVLGNINDGGTHKPSTVAWSGQNLETSWGSNPATQADSQLLAGEGGAIQAITSSSDTSLIFTERSIWTMTYQGPPVIFAFREFPGLGTPAPRSVVQYGDTTYFFGQDGFYRYVLGRGVEPIGDKKVDLWFRARVNKAAWHRMVGAVDYAAGKVMWAYPTGSQSDPTEIIIFDYKTGQWSFVEITTELIVEGISEGYTLEGLDTPFDDGGTGNIDQDLPSLDSDHWKGGVLSLYGFDTAHKSGSFAGMALTARLETIEMSRDDSQMIYCNSARPLTQGVDATNTVYIATRNQQTDNYVYGGAITANSIGEHNTRAAGRYMRFRNDISGGFDLTMGVRVAVQPQGIR